MSSPLKAAPLCSCCLRIVGRPPTPAVAAWTCNTPSRNLEYLCQSCLNFWLGNGDDDPDLEPYAWSWIEPDTSPAGQEFDTSPETLQRLREALQRHVDQP